MRRLIILHILFIVCTSITFSQGLRLQGNEYLIDERTSYLVFDQKRPTFKDWLSVDFEIAPLKPVGTYDMGYILRIKNEIIQTTYNLFYNNEKGTTVFRLNHEGKDILITASFDQKILLRNPWIKIHLLFDLENDSVLLRLNDSVYGASGLGLQNNWNPVLYFGRSEHLIEVPQIAIRKLRIADKESVYCFPLNESTGKEVHDSNRKVFGQVINPVWLINDAYYWKTNSSFYSEKVAGSGFNPETKELYYFNADSISFYHPKTKEVSSKRYRNACPMNIRTGTNFIDPEKKRLYIYEVDSRSQGEVTMAFLDLTSFLWTALSTVSLPMPLHHHTGFLDKRNNRYIIFGGFGRTNYSNDFYVYDLEENQWSTLPLGGDKITPRYFSSMGYRPDENALYLFGGMGNESGDQTVGRVYYYDLYKIDLNNDIITRLWETDWNNENVVPVRSMLMIDNENFYTLCYPEHFSKSLLKLYRFSLKNGDHEILGDSIPITSEKINTHANLYYNQNSSEIYSIIQEFENDDIASTATFYSILSPPVTQKALMYYAEKPFSSLLKILLSVIVLLVVIGLILFIRWRSKRNARKGIDILSTEDSPPKLRVKQEDIFVPELKTNAIYLFGEFKMYDRNKRDITYLLGTKLKQAFLLILERSLDNGISTPEFSDLLWPDRPEDKVKNSRGVTLNNLRKVLSELDGITLIHEKGYYKIVFTSACYCDYIHFRKLISEPHIDSFSTELLQIVSRGRFLKSVESPQLDNFKATVERMLEPVLLVEMEKSYESGNYIQTLRLVEGLFHIDSIHDEALRYQLNALAKLKRVDEARKKYLFFTNEYKRLMDTAYPKSLAELIP
ncbi:MAG: DNA-binding transcriptional activator [Bacteroides sp.]|nr:DNA-binding transcriptional activator [Bacteroides sp.]